MPHDQELARLEEAMRTPVPIRSVLPSTPTRVSPSSREAQTVQNLRFYPKPLSRHALPMR